MNEYQLNRLIWDIARQAVAPAEQSVTDGVVGAVEGGKAAVALNGSDEYMPGFTVVQGLTIAPGDHVLCFRLGGYQVVLAKLTGTVPPGLPPPDVTQFLMDVGLFMDDALTMDGGT